MNDDDADRLSPPNINYFAIEVARGDATPEDAKRLLREFVRQAPVMIGYLSRARGGDQRGWQYLVEHMAACVGAYLSGRKTLEKRDPGDDTITIQTKTLDKAFGIVRARAGPPPIDDDTLGEVAGQVLREMLRGASLEGAAHNVGVERKAAGLRLTADTEIRDCWARHKMAGWLSLRLMRIWGIEPGGWWTDAELARLDEIYRDVPGFVRPGERPFEGRKALPPLGLDK